MSKNKKTETKTSSDLRKEFCEELPENWSLKKYEIETPRNVYGFFLRATVIRDNGEKIECRPYQIEDVDNVPTGHRIVVKEPDGSWKQELKNVASLGTDEAEEKILELIDEVGQQRTLFNEVQEPSK